MQYQPNDIFFFAFPDSWILLDPNPDLGLLYLFSPPTHPTPPRPVNEWESSC